MKEELLKGLSEEQIARIKACQAQEEMLALAKEEGVELTEERLEAVSRGSCSVNKCPNCGETLECHDGGFGGIHFYCPKCDRIINSDDY